MFAVECKRFYGGSIEQSMLHCSLGPVKEPVLLSFMTGVCSS